MHFTGLKIVGFKSFADPVDFAIREGLTGIVGPNGCGKSNILESLRWVMGATSARAMRGGEMDDLIFSGSSNRPQRENAEVALILDNSARRAPAELNDSDELEVKRRLRRGAGSTYKINGRTVRAKDVQLLFADASTGANSPALVRQGQISELIASKPQNRRRILEEAAGIAGLNQRRHEAELKLRGAADSLSRLDEIIGEVDKQLNTLKRQASRAKKYRALQEQIEMLEAQIAYYKWKAAREETALAQASVLETSQSVQEYAQLEASSAATELNLRDQIPPLRENESEASAHLGLLKLEIAKLDGERKAASDSIVRLEQDLKRIVEDQSREHALREEALTSAERAKVSLNALPEEDQDTFDTQLASLRTELAEAQHKLRIADTESDNLATKLATAQAEASSAKAALERAILKQNNLETEKQNALASLADLGSSEKLEAQQTVLAKQLKMAEKALSDGQDLADKLDVEANTARKNEKESITPLNEAEKNIRSIEAQIAGLQRLVGKKQSSQSAPILDETHPNAGLERALAAALGDDLNASMNQADSQYWSDSQAQHLSPMPDGATPLNQLVEAPAALAARLSQCGLVEAEDAARLKSQLKQGQRLVSKEGDLWRWDGFVRTAKAPSSASEKLEQRALILDLEKQLSKANKAADKLRTAQQNAAKALVIAQEKARDSQRALPVLTQAASRAKQELMQNEQALERLMLRRSNVEDNVSRIEDALLQTLEDVVQAKASLSGGPSEKDTRALEDLRADVRKLREEEREYHNSINNLEHEQSRSRARKSALERELKDWSRRADSADIRLTDLHTQRTGVRRQLESANAQPDDIADKLSTLNSKLEAANATRTEASNALSQMETQLREAETQARQARDASAKARETLIRSETRLEAAQRREEDISENIKARFELDFEALEKLNASFAAENLSTEENQNIENNEISFSVPQAETQLALLMRDRESLGGVNMEADLQVEETANRLETQLREREDLDQAIAKLQEGVQALNAQGRTLLLEAFEKVSEHFRVLFEALFEGGEAHLELTESDDPLQAGLEIFACPPGKRLSALSLMSGGEQALTAAALIFAVFLSQPSPLCVLDEVDAPLDDANVDRFCRMLDTMRSRTDTRFIVITHNPVTMSRMDRLYGVTMQERGVSRLVSVDLQSAEQLVAAQ